MATTPDHAEQIRARLLAGLEELSREGFGLRQIGAAMMGVGSAVYKTSAGPAATLDILDGLRAEVLRGADA